MLSIPVFTCRLRAGYRSCMMQCTKRRLTGLPRGRSLASAISFRGARRVDTNPVPAPNARVSPADLRLRKGGVPIVCLTAYSAPMTRLIDNAVDLILVGDSLGMVVYGFETTVPVTLDMMIRHGAAVARGARHAGVKIEGGEIMAETIRFLVDRGIPVLGHIGLQPQSANTVTTGGFRAQGKSDEDQTRILADARAVAAAGAFAVVVEGVT